VLVEAGFFILGNHCGDGTEGVITALAATAIWSAIIPASVAACSESLWDRFIRGGCVADCGFISFCIIWLWLVAGGEEQSLWWVLKAYCVTASVVLVGCASVAIPRTLGYRCLSAVVTALFFTAVLSSPVWVNAFLGFAEGYEQKSRMAAWSVRINPFFALCDASDTGFSWTEASWMYGHTAIGEDVAAGPVAWYETFVLYSSLALILGLIAWLRRLRAGLNRSSLKVLKECSNP